jgi:hypothetical protein
MLNVSATQELAKKVDALEAENDRLRTQANKLAVLESKMETLEKLMSVSNHKNPPPHQRWPWPTNIGNSSTLSWMCRLEYYSFIWYQLRWSWITCSRERA